MKELISANSNSMADTIGDGGEQHRPIRFSGKCARHVAIMWSVSFFFFFRTLKSSDSRKSLFACRTFVVKLLSKLIWYLLTHVLWICLCIAHCSSSLRTTIIYNIMMMMMCAMCALITKKKDKIKVNKEGICLAAFVLFPSATYGVVVPTGWLCVP